jgi:signal transduction histidine kinase
MGRSMGMGAMGSGQRLQHFLESPERQWVLQGRGWHRMRGVEPLVIARKRPNGDVLVVRASLDRLRETVSPASVETLFRNLSLGKTIMTIALADDGGIIRIASDPRWHGRGVAEFDKGLRREQPDALLLDRPVETGDGTTPARLLLGLATASAERNLAQTRRGILLMGFTTLLVGVIGLAVIVRVQQRSLERVEALQRAVARSQRMASLGQMAGQVAHEIRNPLNAITLTVQNLRRQLDQWADRPASLATYFAATQQELARLNRIVEDFLKVSRFPEPKRQPIELNEWLRTFLPLYEAQAREQGIHLQLTGTAEPLTAPVDSDQFRQALGNVIANALQASPAGATIRVTVARSRAGVEITVQDEGKGIPSDLLERVFELYFTTRADGSGLGLPIAQRVMEEHGGSLTLDSRVGKGTIATLRLPLA